MADETMAEILYVSPVGRPKFNQNHPEILPAMSEASSSSSSWQTEKTVEQPEELKETGGKEPRIERKLPLQYDHHQRKTRDNQMFQLAVVIYFLGKLAFTFIGIWRRNADAYKLHGSHFMSRKGIANPSELNCRTHRDPINVGFTWADPSMCSQLSPGLLRQKIGTQSISVKLRGVVVYEQIANDADEGSEALHFCRQSTVPDHYHIRQMSATISRRISSTNFEMTSEKMSHRPNCIILD
ncbi:hypothetical protein DFH08DRAFT_1014244 [Mycena albidolilacea]|uniref:Uncharacterized protein n=1 Tax=Mycena albidolilacea TaxID=1033008 RepID=A0AAD7ENE9_9AGAR|nr:hypothetical protein DFH08DRAFT_1014244 [Mycena albidolilacea]